MHLSFLYACLKGCEREVAESDGSVLALLEDNAASSQAPGHSSI